MKFRQKIFLITFAFVTISIDLIGIITINNNYKNLINSRIENNISNINNIENILKFYDVNNINSSLFNRENVFYEISKNNKIIYTNLSINKSDVQEKIKPEDEKIKSIILNETLYMSAKQDEYEIILAEKIEDVFKNKQEQIDFFIKVSIISSFVIALCLYIAIFLLTRRINKLNKAVKQIQSGNYLAKVDNIGSDEIGKLVDSFNEMARSIYDNITEIERVSENRKNFIQDITHEIRTPLTSIIGYSSLIKNRKINDMNTIIEYNNKIYEEGNYLNLISQRLIDIVLLDNRKIELNEVNISENIMKIIENMKNNFSNINYIQNIEENIIIKSDEILINSLVTNILKNAIMAFEENSEKNIEIIFKDKILKIKDNGKGMTKEQLKKVIEPFYTLNKDRNRKISGMGLRTTFMYKNM